MKIGFVCYDHIRFSFLRGIANALMAKGHEVQAFMEEDGSGKYTKCRWMSFDAAPIHEFEPDRLIIFNGYAAQSTAATTWLRQKYNTFFIERGWLPQGGHIYMDKYGLGARSSIAEMDLSRTYNEEVEKTYWKLKEKFKPGDKPADLGEYILVPLQLEHDTSILLDSPYFKTMRSLVDFVTRRFYDHKVVVKIHPHGKPFESRNGEKVVAGPDMNTLAFYAKAVVGINSTSIIEAMVHMKPVVMFGKGVLDKSQGFIHGQSAMELCRGVLNPIVDENAYKSILYNLHNLQFPINDVPDYVVQRIEEFS